MYPPREYRFSTAGERFLGSVVLLCVAFLASSCSSRPVFRPEPSPAAEETVRNENNPAIDRHAMLVAIMALMSTPYKPQGTDTNGFDCSGFITRIYDAVTHRRLPRSAREQFEIGREVSKSDMEFGDLVFFHLDEPGPSHVGIYVGDGLFAHASVSRGVTLSLFASLYYHTRYIGARRVVW